MSAKLAVALVVVAFLITVLTRLPATALTPFLPKDVSCDDPSGTLWQGACAQVRSGEFALSGLHWTMHPVSLLGAHVRLDLHSTDPRATGQGTATLGLHGAVELQGLTALLPLQGGLTPFPSGWSGELEFAIPHARIEGRTLASVEGRITAQHLRSTRPDLDLGGVQLDFPPSTTTPQVGTLRDLGGPLALQGTVRLSPGGSFELNAIAAARDPGNTDLQQLLMLLGPADAQGRHQLSLGGTL